MAWLLIFIFHSVCFNQFKWLITILVPHYAKTECKTSFIVVCSFRIPIKNNNSNNSNTTKCRVFKLTWQKRRSNSVLVLWMCLTYLHRFSILNNVIRHLINLYQFFFINFSSLFYKRKISSFTNPLCGAVFIGSANARSHSLARTLCQINDQSMPELWFWNDGQNSQSMTMPNTKIHKENTESKHYSIGVLLLFLRFFFSFKSTSVVMIIPDYYCYYESPICDTYAFCVCYVFDCGGKRAQAEK